MAALALVSKWSGGFRANWEESAQLRVAWTDGGLTPAGEKSWKGEALEAMPYLRLVGNWC